MFVILFQPRVIVVLLLLFGFALAKRLYAQHQRSVRAEAPAHPPVPVDLRAGDRTWVVFTTPFCATCGPVTARLRAADPAASVVTVDATERVDLAHAFSVRSAPTVLLADARGRVQTRLVGAAAVDSHLSTLTG